MGLRWRQPSQFCSSFCFPRGARRRRALISTASRTMARTGMRSQIVLPAPRPAGAGSASPPSSAWMVELPDRLTGLPAPAGLCPPRPAQVCSPSRERSLPGRWPLGCPAPAGPPRHVVPALCRFVHPVVAPPSPGPCCDSVPPCLAVTPACHEYTVDGCAGCAGRDECAWCASLQQCMTVSEIFSANCRGQVFDLPCPESFVGGMFSRVGISLARCVRCV